MDGCEAAAALRKARQAGLHLQVEGKDLVLEADAPPPGEVLDLLRQHKPEVIRLLRREGGTWSTEDWQAYWGERAAIAEYDGGLPREEAETQAFAACMAEWLDQNPVCSEADRCVHCGRPEEMGKPLLPCGTELTGVSWLHPHCWEEWYAGRREQTIAALEAIGIKVREPPHE